MKLSTLKIKTPQWAIPLLKPSRYKGAHGGRGSGKSHFFAELLVERCIMQKTEAVCVREIQKSLSQSVKKLIENKIEYLGVGHMFEVQEARIYGPNGSMIIFQGMQNHTADSIKSLEGYDVAWVEEAQTLSQYSLDLLRPTIRKDGSELWFSWNPKNDTDPVDVFLRCDNPPPDSVVIQVNYSDNPWLPDVLREEMEYDRNRDFDKYMHVWMGHYEKKSEALVFKNWKDEKFDTPEDAIFRFGADWGYAEDPTVLIRCYIDGRKLYIDQEAYAVGCEIVDTPALFKTIEGSEKWPIVADSSRPETISHVKKNGFPKIVRSVKGKGSIEDGIEWLRSYDIIVHQRCVHTVEELKSYSYKTDPLTEEILPILEDKNNHVIDALRYACESARRIKEKTKREVRTVPTYTPMSRKR